MYDAINARFLIQDEGQHEALLVSEAFGNQRSIRHDHIQARWKGFELYLKPYELLVRGSLHSLAHGHNVGRFTRPALIESIGTLSEALNLTADQLTLYRVEFGVNLPMNEQPTLFLDTLRMHRGRLFYPMRRPGDKGRPIGLFAPHENCEIKCYDKSRYTRLTRPCPQNILRFEVKVTGIRWLLHLLQRAGLTLADLPDPTLMHELGAILEREWHHSLPPEVPPLANVKPSHAALLLAADNFTKWEPYLKTLESRKRENQRKAVRELRHCYPTAPHPLTSVFRDELDHLLNDQSEPDPPSMALPPSAEFF